jgi:hypothetical protein
MARASQRATTGSFRPNMHQDHDAPTGTEYVRISTASIIAMQARFLQRFETGRKLICHR